MVKKKIIYLTTAFNDKSPGVSLKIRKQIELLRNNKFEVEIINPYTDKLWRKYVSLLPLVNINFNYDKLKAALNDVFCIYIRYFLCDNSLIKVLKFIKKKYNIKIIIEIPTFPYDNEMCVCNPKLYKDKFTRTKLKNYVDKIITFSADKFIFGIPTLNISNGVDTNLIRKRTNIQNGKTINLIAVAYINYYHGFDRIIEGLYIYYNNGGKKDFVIHIVGNGKKSIIHTYKEAIVKYGLQEHIILHGQKVGKELDELYNISTLAFDSLGRHRSGVFYNSSLKGKEYLAKGLPIISGVETELDKDDSFKYYLRVPADDSPIDFNNIMDFYTKVYDNENADKIINKIRSYCEEKYSINVTFQPIINIINA